MQNDMNLFDYFGFGELEAPKKEEKKTASSKKVEAKKEEKKVEKKSPTKKKGEKEVDFEVMLPVTVRARGFSFEIPSAIPAKFKVSEVFKRLDEEGFAEVRLPGIDCAYDEEANVLYITTNGVIADADSSMVEFPEDGMITILDGLTKCEVSLEDFPGKEDDEVSNFDLIEYWNGVDARYKGCKMLYNDGFAYPVFNTPVADKEIIGLPVSVLVNGEWHEVTDADFEGEVTAAMLKQKFFGMENSVVSAALSSNVDKNVYFLSYNQKKTSTSKKGVGATKKADKKKVEEKYALPLEVFVATFGRNYSLTPADFEGKEKVTLDEVRKHFEGIHKIFADKSRNLDAIYLKDENLLSLNFVSGKKGLGAYALTEREVFGPKELLRHDRELEDAIKRPFFSGTLVNVAEHPEGAIQVESFPFGTFLLTQDSEKGTIKGVRFRYKLPKIPATILNMVIAYFRTDLKNEAYVKLCYRKSSGEYFLVTGTQKVTPISVEYTFDSTLLHDRDVIQVMDIHSHNIMSAHFSSIDDRDECYPGIFGVIGKLQHSVPHMAFRAGYEGIFASVSANELFEEE